MVAIIKRSLYIIGFLVPLFISTSTFATLYKYSELELKSYDELIKEVRDKITKAQETEENAMKEAGDDVQYDTSASIFILKDALRMIFSRPNKDNMIDKLLPEVRALLVEYGAYYDSINDLAVESVSGLKQKLPIVYKSTYIFVLENIMSEFRPNLKSNEEVKKIFFYIRDSKASVPDDVRLDRKLRSMFNSQNPCETAEKIIELELPKDKRKEKKSFWDRLFG